MTRPRDARRETESAEAPRVIDSTDARRARIHSPGAAPADLTSTHGSATEPASPLPPLPHALEAELAALCAVAPRRPRLQFATLMGVSLVWAAAALFVLGVRADFGELPVAWFIAFGLSWLCGFAGAAFLALVPSRRSMTPRWQAATAAAVVAPVALMTAGVSVTPHGVHSLHYGLDNLLRGHACMWIGLLVALVPAIVGARLLRGALAVRSRQIAAALGAASGCLGGLLLHAHCPIADGYHVGVIHGGVVVVAAVLAAAMVPRVSDDPFRAL